MTDLLIEPDEEMPELIETATTTALPPLIAEDCAPGTTPPNEFIEVSMTSVVQDKLSQS